MLTTPHDVTEGFLECIRFGSRLFDVALDEFLRRTSVARLSTTIGTNLLVQQKGARIGLDRHRRRRGLALFERTARRRAAS